jgi:hypothetical protein
MHIFFIKFQMREGDPSFLQTSASSDLSEFGMTGYFLGHWYGSNSFSFLYIIVQRGYVVVTTLNIAE